MYNSRHPSLYCYHSWIYLWSIQLVWPFRVKSLDLLNSVRIILVNIISFELKLAPVFWDSVNENKITLTLYHSLLNKLKPCPCQFLFFFFSCWNDFLCFVLKPDLLWKFSGLVPVLAGIGLFVCLLSFQMLNPKNMQSSRSGNIIVIKHNDNIALINS